MQAPAPDPSVQRPHGVAEEDWALTKSNLPGTCLAVLQLTETLAASHTLALRLVHPPHALRLLLTMPKHVSTLNGESMLASIVKRVLEDPACLQSRMEAEIRAIYAEVVRAGATPLSGRGYPVTLKAFLGRALPLARREPRVFLAAFHAACEVAARGGNVVVTLRPEGPGQPTAAVGAEAAAAGSATPQRRSMEQGAGAGAGEATAAAAAGGEGGPARAGAVAVTPTPRKDAPRVRKRVVSQSFVDVVDLLVSLVMEAGQPGAVAAMHERLGEAEERLH